MGHRMPRFLRNLGTRVHDWREEHIQQAHRVASTIDTLLYV